ncbi:MAG: N-acetylmuramoyl-L-alanine amidase [Chloroflexota bacterium]|nr:N-acetylmuramoyl-L-alanine amidase [Chloroflexota bacterium]MDE2948060.1 N-acetylmuramoyl-L-alanine amidase [Chloroflexota bacterium]
MESFEASDLMSRRTHQKRRGPSRRQVIQGLAAASAACLAAVATGLLRSRPRLVVLPHADDRPAASPQSSRPAIVRRGEWGALPVDHSARNEYGFYERASNPAGWYVYEGDLRDSYQTLIMHHSAFYEADGLATLTEVQRLHREDRGWADIGYHFLVDIDGAVYEGRELAARGVHTAGHNTGSAGLCLLGDYRFTAPSAAQWAAAAALGRWLAEALALTHLAGHSQFNPSTACPGAALLRRLPGLAEQLGLQYGIDGYVPMARAADGCNCGSPL